MNAFTVRWLAVTDADQDFLTRVYASTRAAELALTGWDVDACDAFVRMQFKAQAKFYEDQWPKSEHSVIEVSLSDGFLPAGRLWIDRRADAIHVLDIALLPVWCGQGIGTFCLDRLKQEAAKSGCSLTIQVEQGNPARRLYDRLGFQPVGMLRGLHQLMAWRPDACVAFYQEEVCNEQT